MSPAGTPAARRFPWRARSWALALACLSLAAPASGAARGDPRGDRGVADRPRLMMLAFAVPQVGGVPHSPRYKGILSREIPREIGRRMAGLIRAETRFYAVRTTVVGRPAFVVPQNLSTPAETLEIGRGGNATFVLDGVVSATDTLKIRVRLFQVSGGLPLWQSVYEKPTDQAGRLLAQAARDLALALPDGLGEAARGAPWAAREPDWDALVAYLGGEDLCFSRDSRVTTSNPRPILDAFLESIRQDPAYDVAADALIREAYGEIRRAAVPAAVPLGALERMAALRPRGPSYAALARGQALAGLGEASYGTWQKSVEADPAFAEGWLALAREGVARGKYLEAAAALEKVIGIGLATPLQSARIKRDLGVAYLAGREIEKAIKALEASVKDNPEDPDTYDRLGSAYEMKAKTVRESPEIWSDRASEAYRTASRLRNPPDENPGGAPDGE